METLSYQYVVNSVAGYQFEAGIKLNRGKGDFCVEKSLRILKAK